MKKILVIATAALALGACAADSNMLGSSVGAGNSMLKMAVDNQCRTELNNRNEWRLVALAMTAEKQREWEDKICGCASEEAVNQTGVNDLTQMMNPATRNQAIASVTAKTVTACKDRLFK